MSNAKSEVDPGTLAGALNVAVKFAGTSPAFPLASCFYLHEQTVRASNGSVGVEWSIPCSFADPIVVNATNLTKLVRTHALQGKPMSLSIESNRCIVRAGSSRVSLPVMAEDVDALLSFSRRSAPTEMQSVTPEFWAHVSSALDLASKDEATFNGVFIYPSGIVVAGTRQRIVIFHPQGDARVRPAEGRPVFIPRHFLDHIDRNVLRTANRWGEHDGALWIGFDNGLMWGASLQAEFPAARVVELLKTARGSKDSLDFKDSIGLLTKALDRVVLLTSDPHAIELTYENASVRIRTDHRQSDVPQIDETVPCEVQGSGTLYVNAKLLREAVLLAPIVQPEGEHMLYCKNEHRTCEVIVTLLAPFAA